MTGQRTRPSRMPLAAALSLLVHAAVLLAIMWRPVVPAPQLPVDQAVVQVLLTKGQGDHRARGGQAPLPVPPRPVQRALPKPPRPASAHSRIRMPPAPPPMRQPPTAVQAPAAPRQAKQAAKPTPKKPNAAAHPAKPNLPMEFGSLGGPSVVVRNNPNKTVEVTTRPDKGNLAPTYPPAAARLRETGTVALILHIAADGFVDHVDVVKSSGYPLLDQAAVARLRTWHFTPATRGGIPVSSIYKIAVTFGP